MVWSREGVVWRSCCFLPLSCPRWASSSVPSYWVILGLPSPKVKVLRAQRDLCPFPPPPPLTSNSEVGSSQDLGTDLVYPSPAWPDWGTQQPGSLRHFPAFASFSGAPLFPHIAFILSASLSQNLDLVHTKCSKTLMCYESIFMSVSCCLPLSLLPSLCPFFPSCLSLFLPGGNSQRPTGSLLQDYPAGQQGEPRWAPPPPTSLSGPGLPGTPPTPNLQWGLCTSFCQQLKQINQLQAVTLCGFLCSHRCCLGSGVKHPFRERRPVAWSLGPTEAEETGGRRALGSGGWGALGALWCWRAVVLPLVH